jgi:hypothetical protein
MTAIELNCRVRALGRALLHALLGGGTARLR